MTQLCDREGTFRAQIMESGIKEMDSGSVSVALRASLLEMWDPGNDEWVPWSDYGMEAEGDVWIVKKDGTLNQPAIESLMKYAGWDGSIESIANGTWLPGKCQVTIKRDDYKGQARFKIAFVNDYERTPGALSNVNADKARELQNRFGGQLRALAGNVRRNGQPAPGKPAAPPPAAVPLTPQTHPSTVASDEKIPF